MDDVSLPQLYPCSVLLHLIVLVMKTPFGIASSTLIFLLHLCLFSVCNVCVVCVCVDPVAVQAGVVLSVWRRHPEY